MATPVQGTARAYVVWVKFQIQPGEMDQFMPLMLANVRALQADEFGNPAQLWLARGAQRWREPQGAAGHHR